MPKGSGAGEGTRGGGGRVMETVEQNTMGRQRGEVGEGGKEGQGRGMRKRCRGNGG